MYLAVCVLKVKAYFLKNDFHKSICWLGKLVKRRPLNQTDCMNEVLNLIRKIYQSSK